MTMRGGYPQVVIPNFPSVIPNFPSVIPNGVRNLRSPSDGLPITTTVFRVRRRLRDSLNKSPWMRRMDVKPVPTEGRGSRIRENDGLQASCSEVP